MSKFLDLRFLIFLLVIVLVVYSFTAYNPSTYKKRVMKKILQEVKNFNTSIVDECEFLMLRSNSPYVLCTIKDGKLVPLKSNIFHPGEYLGLQVNLKKLRIPFKEYYACVYYDIPIYETKYPKKYGPTKPGIYSPYFICFTRFKNTQYHHIALSGFILPKPGNYSILKLYIFNASEKIINFKTDLNKSIKMLDLRGEII